MKKTAFIGTAIFLLVVVVVATPTAFAEGPTTPNQDWSKLKIVTYSSGLTGFFDPDTGKLYLYDSNLENCFAIRQLTKLGEPMKKLQN
jgi:hypothetical protein